MDLLIPSPKPHEPSPLPYTLSLIPHPEGGYYTPTYTSPNPIYLPPTPTPSPSFSLTASSTSPSSSPETRPAASCIYYVLTPHSPIGHFHKNKSTVIHFLHKGRGRYVLVREGGEIESFRVGGEEGRWSWVVEGGVWKASFLEGEELFISEVVVPGFDFKDHEFMKVEELVRLVGREKADVLSRLCKE